MATQCSRGSLFSFDARALLCGQGRAGATAIDRQVVFAGLR